MLEGLAADVIGLQEVEGRDVCAEHREPLAGLGRRLGMDALAGPNLRSADGEYGNGLLTRLPFRDVARLDLSQPGCEPRGAISAALDAGSHAIRVWVTHLGLEWRERKRQLDRLQASLGSMQEADRTLLMGDFNEWVPKRLGRHALSRSHPFRTALPTFPSRLPVLPLDRVLIRPRPTRVHAFTVRTLAARAASDHLPLVVDVDW